MEDSSVEYQYIVTELNANKIIRNVTETYIAELLNIVHNKRKILSQLDTIDGDLNRRLDAIGHKDKTIVTYG